MLYTPSTAKEYEYVYTQHKLINKIMKPVLPAFYFYPRDNGNCKGPIKVGIVSGDFQNHPVSYFIAPFLEGYSPTVFKVTCYTESVVDTTKFRDCVQWKNTQGTTSASLASRIRADAQDILIDLAGHSRHNRLAVFAERAAPVQIEYIGYPCTTGLSAMDYRIVDTTSDPRIDDAEYTQQYTEKLLSLDRCFLCYSVTKTPSLKSESRQGVTFGCFNRLNKVTEEYIAFVNELLTENPTFRFLFKTKGFSSKTVKTAFESRFSPQIRPRVCLMECTVTLEESLEVYNQIDFSVDTFPYNGTTTTCESLSMGVPVFTVRDTKHGFHASNVSASILTHSGLSEYIHDSFTEILSKVKNWPVPDKQSVRTAFLTGNVTNKQDFNTKIQKLLVSVSVSV
jgi:predicted O-linked N-acetylglucosamine transferase (SPINDLY family)